MAEMLVTVVTVCYNSSETIESTIKSVLSQTYPNIEFVVKDGGSTDGTLKILNNYKKRIDVILSGKDKGTYDGMNIAVKKAHGEVVVFLNSNDFFYDENVVSDVVKEFSKDVDFVYGDVHSLYADEGVEVLISRNASLSDLRAGNMPQHQSAFVRRSLLLENPYDVSYRSASDFDFFCRIVKDGARGRKIDRIISKVLMGGISAGAISYRETERIVYKHFGSFYWSMLVIKHRSFSLVRFVLSKTGLLRAWHKLKIHH